MLIFCYLILCLFTVFYLSLISRSRQAWKQKILVKICNIFRRKSCIIQGGKVWETLKSLLISWHCPCLKVLANEKRGGLKVVAFDKSPFKLFTLKFSKEFVKAPSCKRPKTTQRTPFLSFKGAQVWDIRLRDFCSNQTYMDRLVRN